MCQKPRALQAQPGQTGSEPAEVHISEITRREGRSRAMCRADSRLGAWLREEICKGIIFQCMEKKPQVLQKKQSVEQWEIAFKMLICVCLSNKPSADMYR